MAVDLLILAVVIGGCMFAYVAIGDLFDKFFGGDRTPEEDHQHVRPLSPNDRPAHDPRKDIGGFVDETYGKSATGLTTPRDDDPRG